MSYQEDFDIAQRYDLLCRASQSSVEQDGQRLQLAADLAVLDKIINYDLPELARSGSPDHFADILKNLNLELEHFREFCEFPDLAQKVVVGVGGAFSAGKSSLINTLLGKKRLVVEIDPTTSLPTYLLHGKQEQITALNLFRRRVTLSQDEFASLTHEEKIKYGSQIAGLLRSAFVCDPDFAWKNIALLDIPGYSKPDSEQWSERTDESVARSQLNLSNFIIWVVSATQGTISEDDLKFLATLNADIPKLIVVSRADAKIPEDVAKIVALVKQTTAERGINILDVVAVSARKKNDYPVQPIIKFLEEWNSGTKKLNFTYNFRKLFTEYARYMQDKQKQAQVKLDQINQMIFLSDNEKILENAYKLQGIEQDNINNWQTSVKNYDDLQTKFFDLIKNISDQLSSHTEQFIDLYAVLSDKNCSTEMLSKYAKVVDDELLQIIYHHANCPISILEDLINKPIGSLSFEIIELLLSNKTIRQENQRIYEHLDMVNVNLLSRMLRLEIASSPFLSEKTQLILIKNIFPLLAKVLASNPSVSEILQLKIIEDDNDFVKESLAENINIIQVIKDEFAKDKYSLIRKKLALNLSINEKIQLELVQDVDSSVRISLAENINIIPDIQLQLALDDNDIVRCSLASNKNITRKVQLLLSRDKDIYVLIKLFHNFSLCNDIKSEILKNSEVRAKLSQLENFNISKSKDINIEMQRNLVKDKDRLVRSNLAKNPKINIEIQWELAWDEDSLVRSSLASNSNIVRNLQLKLIHDEDKYVRSTLAICTNYIEVMQELIKDEDISVRSMLARNPNIDQNLQLKLVQDKEIDIKRELSKNKNINENIQLKLNEEADDLIKNYLVSNINISENTQLKFIEDNDFSSNSRRESLAENPNITEKVQLILANDKYFILRARLAKNSNISEIVQLKLAQDEDEYVRNSLFTNPNLSVKVEQLLSSC